MLVLVKLSRSVHTFGLVSGGHPSTQHIAVPLWWIKQRLLSHPRIKRVWFPGIGSPVGAGHVLLDVDCVFDPTKADGGMLAAGAWQGLPHPWPTELAGMIPLIEQGSDDPRAVHNKVWGGDTCQWSSSLRGYARQGLLFRLADCDVQIGAVEEMV